MQPIPDLDHLRSLLTVARLGSVSAAAQALLRSQSAISVHVQHLEAVLGHALVRRHARGVTLTREGALAVDYGNRILTLVQQLRDELSAAPLSHAIRLGLSEDYAIGRLPRLLREFAEARETLDLQLVVAQSSGLDAHLRDGKIDLALAVPEVMSMEPIARWTVPLLWVASRDYLVDPAKPLPLVTIGNLQESSVAPPHPWDARITAQLERKGLRWRVACATSTVASMLAAVEAGIGISYFTRESLRPTVRVLSELDGMPPPIFVEFGLFTSRSANLPELEPLIHVLTRTVLSDGQG